MPDIPSRHVSDPNHRRAAIIANERDLKITKKMLDADLAGAPAREAYQLLFELRLYGFAVSKRISQLTGKPCGEMECPMCGSVLRYSTAESNGHFAASCTRRGCIKAME